MNQLTNIRQQRGMSRQQLAETVGTSCRSIAAYETGYRRPSPQIAQKIAKVFGLTTVQMWEMFFEDADGESRCC